MFARTPVQSRWWRLFAIAATAFVTPLLIAADSTTEWARSVATAIALFGLIGYSFGFRVGPQLFWGAFGAVFCTMALVKLGAIAASGSHKPAAGVVAFAMVGALGLALFRHAGLVTGGRRGGADEKPERMFPSRAEQWRRLHEQMARERAILEQPMSAAMQYEASLLGPGRQLSFKQHQRLIRIMFPGTVAAQLALAVSNGGNSAILIPAAAFAIGSAVATYLSAEVILRAQPRLANTWKGVALLLGLAAVPFVIRDQTSIMVWPAKMLFTNVGALALGNVLVSSAYALNRRR